MVNRGQYPKGDTPKERAASLKDQAPPRVIEPLFNDVLVHLFTPEEVMSGGGIVIPDISADTWANRIGIVLAIGPEVKFVKPDDLVIIKEVLLTQQTYTPTKVAMPQLRYNNVTYHLLPEWMIAGKL